MALWFALVLGFFLGVRHATDADHLVAVSTMVRRERGLSGAIRTGALWGLGHTGTVIVVGIAMIVFGVRVSDQAAQGMEMAVALMLVILGAVTVRDAMRARRRFGSSAEAMTSSSESAHGGAHRHGLTHHHTGDGVRAGGNLRPVMVGIIHGLAGSAGLTLMALTTIDKPRLALGYLAVFGLGTVFGMILITILLALPLRFAARRFASAERNILLGAGVVSVGFGLVMAVRLATEPAPPVGEHTRLEPAPMDAASDAVLDRVAYEFEP